MAAVGDRTAERGDQADGIMTPGHRSGPDTKTLWRDRTMAKGIYFECDFCKTLTFKELYEGSQESSVYEEFKKLPNDGGKWDAPYAALEKLKSGTNTKKVTWFIWN